MYMLWFNFILGLKFYVLLFYNSLSYIHTSKQRGIELKPRIKLNHNIYNPNPNPRKCNYYFYLGLPRNVLLGLILPMTGVKMACQTHFLYLLLRLSFFQRSMLNTQGPGSYGAG